MQTKFFFFFFRCLITDTVSTLTFKQLRTFALKRTLFLFSTFVCCGRRMEFLETHRHKKHSHSNKTKSFTVFLLRFLRFSIKTSTTIQSFVSHHFSAVTAASAASASTTATVAGGGANTLSIEGGVKKLFVGVGEFAPMLKRTCDRIEATP